MCKILTRFNEKKKKIEKNLVNCATQIFCKSMVDRLHQNTFCLLHSLTDQNMRCYMERTKRT